MTKNNSKEVPQLQEPNQGEEEINLSNEEIRHLFHNVDILYDFKALVDIEKKYRETSPAFYYFTVYPLCARLLGMSELPYKTPAAQESIEIVLAYWNKFHGDEKV